MNARVKNRKLQAKTAIMIMAPKKAKALLWVVATKPLPVRLLSSVGVRRDGRASRMVLSGPAASVAQAGQLRICLCVPAAYALGELTLPEVQAV